MKKFALIITVILTTIVSTFAQKIDKFSQEIIIDCEQGIEAAKMTSDGTIYGKAKGIDITFPFKTRINPDKGAEIKLEVPGYEEYKLVVPPGGIESNFMVFFTEDIKGSVKNSKVTTSSGKKVANTMQITIDCNQFETAKLAKQGNFSIGTMLLFGSIAASAKQNKETKDSMKDVIFPYTTEIDVDKEHKFFFHVPGYNVYELVIPKGNTETNFRVHFTENPKEMAKLRAQDVKSDSKKEKKGSSKSDKGSVGVSTVSRDNPGKSAPEQTIIRWMVDSDPQGARIFYRVISSTSEVQNTNESYLLTTPYEETRSFNILGLTYENARDVQIEIKIMKPGYHTQVKRFNVRQALDQQEISTFFQLVKKEEVSQ